MKTTTEIERERELQQMDALSAFAAGDFSLASEHRALARALTWVLGEFDD